MHRYRNNAKLHMRAIANETDTARCAYCFHMVSIRSSDRSIVDWFRCAFYSWLQRRVRFRTFVTVFFFYNCKGSWRFFSKEFIFRIGSSFTLTIISFFKTNIILISKIKIPFETHSNKFILILISIPTLRLTTFLHLNENVV